MERVITPVLTTSQLDYIARRVAEFLARKMPPPEPEIPMDTGQCAKFLNMNETAVLRQAQRGMLPGYKSNGKWRFFKSEIIKAIKETPSTEG